MKLTIGAAVLALGLGAAVGPAQATLTLQQGLVGGSGDVDNVIFNACGLGNASGSTVQGCLNSNHNTRVNFTGQETLTTNEGGGQARIVAQDGNFDYVRIAMADPTLGFAKLQFNLDVAGSVDGTANFQAVDQFGNVFNFNNIALDAQGQNFFTLGSQDGQVAVSFTLLSTVPLEGISDLQQVRIGAASINGGPNPIPVPEPTSMLLFGAALLGFGAVRRA